MAAALHTAALLSAVSSNPIHTVALLSAVSSNPIHSTRSRFGSVLRSPAGNLHPTDSIGYNAIPLISATNRRAKRPSFVGLAFFISARIGGVLAVRSDARFSRLSNARHRSVNLITHVVAVKC